MRETIDREENINETEALFHERWDQGENVELSEEELERQRLEERARRREKMRQEKEMQAKRRRLAVIAVPAGLIALVCILGLVKLISILGAGTKTGIGQEADKSTAVVSAPSMQPMQSGLPPQTDQDNGSERADEEDVQGKPEAAVSDEETDGANVSQKEQIKYAAAFSEATDGINEEEVQSKYVVLIDLDNAEVLAAKEGKARINPASMTKILTLLTAADHIDDLDDTFKMTIEITDYSYSHDCSAVGFAKDEVVTVRDLLYGTILPSGGDAAVGLATYVAGSHEAFVELMNEKLKDLGLSGSSHMTNCVGIYDEDHYSTVYDIAMILEAAVNNELCREVLRAHTYTTSQTPEHPDGITVSNWFLRRIEDKDTHGEVVCAKTGFVAQSGNCAASYATDEPGNGFICVTADAHSSWRAIYDHVALYQKYL